MANRFQNVQPGHRRFVPQQWTPNVELMSSLLEQQQKGYDSAMSLADIPIKNIRQDEPVAQNLRKKLRGDIDNLANVFKTEGVEAGNRLRNQLVRDVRQMVLPGGDVHKLGQRVEQYQAHKDNIKELYKDNPLIQQYNLNRLDTEGVLPFEDGRINSPSGMVKHVDAKEISDYLNKAIDNIKDTDLKRLGLSKKQLVNYNYLYETGKITGRKYKDIVNTLVSQMPEEFINSAQQYSNAQGKNINERELFDNEGNLNMQTQMGRIIAGAAHGRAREDLELKTGTFKDDFSLRTLDHQYRKKEIDYEYDKNKSFYEFPSTSTDVVIDPVKEKEQVKLEKEKIKSADSVIKAYDDKLAKGETILPEEKALYEEAIVDKTDSEFIINAKRNNLNDLKSKTKVSLDSRIDNAVSDVKVKEGMKQYMKENPESDLIDAFIASGGNTSITVRGKTFKNPEFEAVNRANLKLNSEIENLDEQSRTFHKEYTLISGTSNTELAKRSKAMSDMFLNGNVSLVTDDGKLFNSKEITNKLAEGKLAIIPVKEPINGRPGFSVISTKNKAGNFFTDGEYGKTQSYVTFAGTNGMIKEQNKRIYRDMYFNGDQIDQQSASYGYGYYATSPNTNLSVGTQIETLNLKTKPSGYSSDAIQTPLGDVYIHKFIGDNGEELYRHDLYKSGTKERIKHEDGEEFTNLFGNDFGITDNPNTIIESIGKYQLQREALK